MGPRGGDQRTPLGRRVAQTSSDAADLLDSLVDRCCNAGCGLEDGRHQLGPHTLVACGICDLVEARHELVALRGEQLELLLDSEAERRAAAEGVLHACSLP